MKNGRYRPRYGEFKAGYGRRRSLFLFHVEKERTVAGEGIVKQAMEGRRRGNVGRCIANGVCVWVFGLKVLPNQGEN